MNFRLGIVVVGSLLWDETPIRHKWRMACIKDINAAIPTPLPIRYGRESSTRHHTHTIILSNHPNTEPGQGLIFECTDPIKSFDNLRNQAFALALAEGISKTLAEPILSKDWGTFALLLNPNIDKKNKPGADLIRTRWTELHKQQSTDFNFWEYRIKDEPPVVDEHGFLNIPWTKEMDDFDLLIATPTVPAPKRVLTAKEVGDAMNIRKYRDYFDKNRSSQIITFQDEEIACCLKE